MVEIDEFCLKIWKRGFSAQKDQSQGVRGVEIDEFCLKIGKGVSRSKFLFNALTGCDPSKIDLRAFSS